MDLASRRFLVAISYAGENKVVADEVAEHLAGRLGPDKVFCAHRWEGELSSMPLALTLSSVFDECELIVVLNDSNYAEKVRSQKTSTPQYCAYEFERVANRFVQHRNGEVVLFRWHNAALPSGWGQDRQHAEFKDPRQCAERIVRQLERLGVTTTPQFADHGFEHLVGFICRTRTSQSKLEKAFELARHHLHAGKPTHARALFANTLNGHGRPMITGEDVASKCLLVVCHFDNKSTVLADLLPAPMPANRVILAGTNCSRLLPADYEATLVEEATTEGIAVAILDRLEYLTGRAISRPGRVPDVVRRHVPVFKDLFEKPTRCAGGASTEQPLCERHHTSLALAYSLGLGQQGRRIAEVNHLIAAMRLCAPELRNLRKPALDMPQVSLLFQACKALLDLFDPGRESDRRGSGDSLQRRTSALQAYLNYHTEQTLSPCIKTFCEQVEQCTRWFVEGKAVNSKAIFLSAVQIHAAVFGALHEALSEAESKVFKGNTLIRGNGDGHMWALGEHIQQLHPRLKRRSAHV